MALIKKNTPIGPPQAAPEVDDQKLYRALAEIGAIGSRLTRTDKFQRRNNNKPVHHYYREEYGQWARKIMDELGQTHGTIVIQCNAIRHNTLRLQWSEGCRWLIDREKHYENYRAHIITRYKKETDQLHFIWQIQARGTAPTFAQMLLQPWQQELQKFLTDTAMPQVTINHNFTKSETESVRNALEGTNYEYHLFDSVLIIIRPTKELVELVANTGCNPLAYPNQHSASRNEPEENEIVTPFALPPQLEDFDDQ